MATNVNLLKHYYQCYTRIRFGRKELAALRIGFKDILIVSHLRTSKRVYFEEDILKSYSCMQHGSPAG